MSSSGSRTEFVTGADGVRRRRYATDYQAPLNEYEAFSADQAWMPNVVLMAKSTYVWLEQLSKKYGRHIHRLDQIPDEELQLLATRGMTGLWLIGLWERSVASQTIKRLRGQCGCGGLGVLAEGLRDCGGPGRRTRPMKTCATARRRPGFGWRATWCRTTWASIRPG